MSETSKHTPRPWVLMPEFHGDHGQYYITDEADGSEIASVTAWIGEHRAEAEANARLIAAAPELLAALKEAKSLAVTMAGLTACRSDDEWVWGIQAKIDAALALVSEPSQS